MSDILMMREILRIITPGEINDLTTMSDGGNRVSLTEIIDDEMDRMDLISQGLEEEMDNILLFRRKRDFRAGSSCRRLFKFLGLNSIEDIQIIKDEIDVEEAYEENKSENIHFLSASEALKESQKKLKSAEILFLYKKTAKINTAQAKKSKEDLSKSSNVGILINKKQA